MGWRGKEVGQDWVVRKLPLVEKPGGILAFDFDGTMYWAEHNPSVSVKLLDLIEFLRKEKGYLWGICTGRSMMHLMEGLSEGFSFLPDFAVTREREIFYPNQFGRFLPDEKWNKRCDKDHRRLFKKVGKELKAVRHYVEEVAKGEWVTVEGDLAGVVLPEEAEMDGLLEEVTRLCAGCQELGYERNGIYLRFSHADYGKGPALLEVARREGVTSSQVVAGGDNFNDLSLFRSEVTGCPICPGNAVPEVKARVKEGGGVVAEAIASLGLVEALEQVFPK